MTFQLLARASTNEAAAIFWAASKVKDFLSISCALAATAKASIAMAVKKRMKVVMSVLLWLFSDDQ
jgi:hypothetical protein